MLSCYQLPPGALTPSALALPPPTGPQPSHGLGYLSADNYMSEIDIFRAFKQATGLMTAFFTPPAGRGAKKVFLLRSCSGLSWSPERRGWDTLLVSTINFPVTAKTIQTLAGSTGTVHGLGIRGIMAVPAQHPLCTNPASWRGQWVSPCRNCSYRARCLQRWANSCPAGSGEACCSVWWGSVLLCAVLPSAVRTWGRKSWRIAPKHVARSKANKTLGPSCRGAESWQGARHDALS